MEDLDKSLDESTKNIDETFKDFIKNLNQSLEMAKTADIPAALNTLSQALFAGEGKIQYTVKGDTLDTSALSTAITDATEDIKYQAVTDEEYLESLNANAKSASTAGMITEMQTSLSAMAKVLTNNDSTAWIQNIHNILAKQLQPDVEAIAKHLKDNSNDVGATVNLNYDALIKVEGSIDSTVVGDIKKIAEDCVDKVKAELYKDLRKNGLTKTY